ncbi:MAG: STAS domain-containing protein [Puniceicoccales bacterium]|jgi:SulP family sulfate permease|nr:STAS domain-containing protein [Puniceicoccales bacterium]
MRQWKKNGLSVLPIYQDFSKYNLEKLRQDAFAGLSVTLIVFPQAMAYALLAGLPIEYGLYGATVAAFAAALFAGSHFISLGPTNATAVLLVNSFAMLGIPTEKMPIFLPTLLVLTGSFLILSAFLNLANVVQYVSRSVISGYITAVAIIVIVNQIHNVLGFNLATIQDNTFTFIDTCSATLSGLPDIEGSSAFVSLITLCIYRFIKTKFPKSPVALTIIALACLTYILQNVMDIHVQVLTSIDASVRHASWVGFSLDNLNLVADSALILSFICLVDSTIVLKSLSLRIGQKANANQMAFGLGLANIFCGLFSGMPVSASLVRSSTNYTSGARTSFASLFCGCFCLLCIICLGPFFHYIPKAGLATLIIILACSFLDKHTLKVVITSTRSDTCVFFVTFVAAFLFPLSTAIYIGVFLSIALFLKKAAVPAFFECTYDENNEISEVDPNTPLLKQSEIAIIHMEGNLFFASSEIFRDQMRMISERPSLKIIILKMRNVMHIDATCILAFEELLYYMYLNKRVLILSEVNKYILKALQRSKLTEFIGLENIFTDKRSQPNLSTALALKHAQNIIGDKNFHVRILVVNSNKKHIQTTAETMFRTTTKTVSHQSIQGVEKL